MLYYGIKAFALSSASVMKTKAVHRWEELNAGGVSGNQPDLSDSRSLGVKQAPCPRLMHSYSATMQIKSAL